MSAIILEFNRNTTQHVILCCQCEKAASNRSELVNIDGNQSFVTYLFFCDEHDPDTTQAGD